MSVISAIEPSATGLPISPAIGRPRVLAILNVTPDSFSDGGETLATDAAVTRAWNFVAQGADALDVGGESTPSRIPGSLRG